MKGALRTTRAVLVASVLVSFPRAVRADDPASESEAHIQRGVELRTLGRNGEALSEFQRANALAPTPRARAQIALALQALGDWIGAESGLKESLGAGDDPWIMRYHAALEGALSTVRAHLAWLHVDANVTGGELFLNGVSTSAIPMAGRVRIAAGTLDLEVRATGHAPARRTIDVRPDADLHERFTLEPLALPPAKDPAEDANREPLRPAGNRRNSGDVVAGYIALVSSGTLGGAGLVAWRVREANIAVYNDDGRCLQGPQTRDQQCGNYAVDANIALALEVAAFIASGVGTALGAWWLLKPDSRSARKASARCAPSVTPGIFCRWEF